MEIRKKIEQLKVTGYICDVCGNSCNASKDKRYESHEYATLFGHWGYDSKRDGDVFECHLCEECYDRVVEFIESIGGKVRTIGNELFPVGDLVSFKKEGTDYVMGEQSGSPG